MLSEARLPEAGVMMQRGRRPEQGQVLCLDCEGYGRVEYLYGYESVCVGYSPCDACDGEGVLSLKCPWCDEETGTVEAHPGYPEPICPVCVEEANRITPGAAAVLRRHLSDLLGQRREWPHGHYRQWIGKNARGVIELIRLAERSADTLDGQHRLTGTIWERRGSLSLLRKGTCQRGANMVDYKSNNQITVYVSSSRTHTEDAKNLIEAVKRTGHTVSTQECITGHGFAPMVQETVKEVIDTIAASDVFVWLTPPDAASAADLGAALAARAVTGHPYIITVAAESLHVPLAAGRDLQCTTVLETIRAIGEIAKQKAGT